MNPNPEIALQAGIQAGWDEQAKAHAGSERLFYASSIGRCVRFQIAQRANLPRTVDDEPAGMVKMWMGTLIHDAMQRVLLAQGYLDPAWTTITDGQIVERRTVYRSYVCKPDGRVLHPISDVVGCPLVEIKTSDDKSLKYPEPPENYFWQAFVNCMAVNEPNVILYRLGRSYGLQTNRLYTLTESWRETIDHHITYMNEEWTKYQQTGVLPDHNHRFKWEDMKCPYLDTSVDVTNEEVL